MKALSSRRAFSFLSSSSASQAPSCVGCLRSWRKTNSLGTPESRGQSHFTLESWLMCSRQRIPEAYVFLCNFSTDVMPVRVARAFPCNNTCVCLILRICSQRAVGSAGNKKVWECNKTQPLLIPVTHELEASWWCALLIGLWYCLFSKKA